MGQFQFHRPYALHDACEEGNVQTVQSILKLNGRSSGDGDDSDEDYTFGGTSIAKRDHFNCTPLHLSILNDRYDCTKLLIDAGSELRILEGSPCTHLALTMGGFPGKQVRALNTLDLLLSNGADINATDDLNRHALHICAFFDLPQCAEYVVKTGTAEILQAKDSDGNTALHTACERGSLSMVIYLLEAKANVHALNDFKQACLHIAAARGEQRITSLLLGTGAKIDVVDYLGLTPMQIAHSYGYTF